MLVEDFAWYHTILAEGIARAAHKDQTIKSTGEDYITHPERVSLLVSEKARPVAWLHDVIEDTSVTAEKLRELGIPGMYVEAVEIVSKREGEPYTAFIQRIADSKNVLAIEVKLADLRDNLRPGCPVSLRERYLRAIDTLLHYI